MFDDAERRSSRYKGVLVTVFFCALMESSGGLAIGSKSSVRRRHRENVALKASPLSAAFDETVMARYACTRFQRFDGQKIESSTEDYPASTSNETVVNLALECLDLARRAPSGFNAQPYKLLLVQTPDQKKALSRVCSGSNAYRVCDSDCTVVFLADREVVRTMGDYSRFLRETSDRWKGKLFKIRKIQVFIALFSSGFPLPRFLGVPITFGIRCMMEIVAKPCARLFGVVVPSLSSAETWAVKNTMLVAMAYMLACTSRGLATCPMEGFNASGIRQALKIPRRYSIPLIVCTGKALERNNAAGKGGSDDVGMSHGKPGTEHGTPRYQKEEVIFTDNYGESLSPSP